MKMMKLLVALLVMAGLVAPAIAVAEDKLSISGEFRVFGFSKENYSDFDDDDSDDELNYFNQRLRLYSKYAVTEGVTIHTRMDFGESTWGDEGQNSVRFDHTEGEVDGEFQLDRAFVEIDKPYFNFRAGQQYYGFGNSMAVDHQGTGFRVSTKGPVVVTAFWNKLDEGDSTSDELDAEEDRDAYGLSLKYKNDAFAVEGFYALDDNSATDAEKSVIGLAASTKFGAVNVKGELNIFDGDDGAGTDYTGTQLYVDANTAVSSAVTLGGSVFYAQGDDEDDVLVAFSDFGSFLPWEYGYFETNYGLYDDGFDPFSLNAGTVSLMGYGSFKASDDLSFKASIQYGQEEDDNVADYDYMSYNVSGNYVIAKNTTFFVQANYLDVDADDEDLDAAMGIAAGLKAKF
jgi:hypothetical protein